jgi:hypothetical protein
MITDEKHMKVMVRINEGDGKEEWLNQKEINTHQCDQEDFDEFYEPHFRNAAKMQELRESGALLCLDKLDVNGDPTSTLLYGRDDISPYRRIEFVYLPCLTYKLMTLSDKPSATQRWRTRTRFSRKNCNRP